MRNHLGLAGRCSRVLFVTATLLLVASYASATSITTYFGHDDGAPIGGPFPNSSAAQAAFLPAAGPTNLINFENVPLGFYTPIIIPAVGVSIDLNATSTGDGYSGISTTTYGNLFGFNITPGGSHWLGFWGGSATFNFATPVDAFGFWTTGLQTRFTSLVTVTFNDPTAHTLYLPIINVNGGASYFGFTDAGGSISSITIADISDDAWGIDDVSYNVSSSASAVPEPASLTTLLGIGAFGALGFAWRRRKQRA